MNTFGWTSFASLVMLLAVQGDEAALKKEHAALEGKWTIVSLETPRGKDKDASGATLEFLKDGKSIEFRRGNDQKKGAYQINVASKPKEITLTPADSNKMMDGIYLLEKNTLKICITEDSVNEGRPTEFAVKEGKRQVLITLERAK